MGFPIPTELNRLAEQAAAPFLGRPITQHTLPALRSAIHSAREQFLSANPEYVAWGDVSATVDEGGFVNIYAPAVTRDEAWRLEQEQSARDALLAEIETDRHMAEAQRARRWKNMLRKLRRLSAAHLHRLPPNTARIFDTLDEGQQYAILKDIDYDIRHGVS